MPKITWVQPDGTRITLAVRAGESLMRAATRNGVAGIVANCGGACACATCHVYLDEACLGMVAAAGPMEREMLAFTAAECRETSRLSCQLVASPELDGLVLHVPECQVAS